MKKIMAIGASVLIMLEGCATVPRGTVINVPGGSYRTISVADLAEMLKTKDFFLVNVHVPYAGEIPKTDAFISYKDTKAKLGDYPRSMQAKIVVYCLTNHMSGVAARDLVLAGYTNVYLVDGGMTAWRKAGFALFDRAVTSSLWAELGEPVRAGFRSPVYWWPYAGSNLRLKEQFNTLTQSA